jgi:methylenetetrahydrofolate dehydrogenase (NADP+)/methenyltetrahydrofolate cyclohydrolase/formyltetrahydrofolate synthetase
VRAAALEHGAFDAVVTDNWALGGIGAKGLAESVVRACEQDSKPRQLYDLKTTIQAKIETIAAKIYGGLSFLVAFFFFFFCCY